MALQVGPFAIQVLHAKRRPLLMGWRMYHTLGSDLCAIRVHVEGATGVSRRVLLAELQPRSRVLRRPEGATRAVRSFCPQLKDGETLRAEIRCGHRFHGWKTVESDPADFCKAERP